MFLHSQAVYRPTACEKIAIIRVNLQMLFKLQETYINGVSTLLFVKHMSGVHLTGSAAY